MNLVFRLDLDLFCILILGLILISQRQRGERRFMEYRLFVSAIYVTMLLLATDAAAWYFEGQTGGLVPAVLQAINVVHFSLHTLAPLFWLLYTDLQIFQDEGHTRRLVRTAAPLALLCSLLAVITPFTGALFSYKGGVYQRGPWMTPFIAANFAYLLIATIATMVYRQRLERRFFWPLLAFILPPGIGAVLQVKFVGLSLIWPGATLSLLSIFINVQNNKLNTDYLTGAYNRMQSDQYLRQRVGTVQTRGAFAGVLVDIDDFKQINDRLGHAAGDAALQTVSALLRKSVRKSDFVARFGGDEFLIILEISDRAVLERSVSRIRETLRTYNEEHGRSPLGLSIGYDVYDPSEGMTDGAFLKHIDALMYLDKAAKGLAGRETR